ncbi:hypothetical protein PIB30_053086, partial [Stylosanthes scabra]|nr:hypothetical protein [Stylosanthes scabra]
PLCNHRAALATHHTTFISTLLHCAVAACFFSLSASFTIIDVVVTFVIPSLSPSLVFEEEKQSQKREKALLVRQRSKRGSHHRPPLTSSFRGD